MGKVFNKGDVLRNENGEVLLTFVRAYTAEMGGIFPNCEDILLSNGEHPAPGQEVDPEVGRLLEQAARS